MSSPVVALLDQQRPDQIRSRPQLVCYVCGAQGATVHEGLRDTLFGASGVWSFRRCSNEACGLLWLDPMPMEEDIGKAYSKYYTHVDGPVERIRALRRWASALFRLVNPLHEQRESLCLMCLDGVKPGKVLDVGCGNGVRLERLRSLGWDVYGQDVDPVAVANARETLGIEAHLGRLEDGPFKEESFDCITLNHVIEHSHDPVGLLKECRRLLKGGGLLVIVTPNAGSFASRYFGSFWRGLEPPRHIHLFSPTALSTAAAKAGLTIRCSSTTSANAKSFGRASLLIRNGGNLPQALWGKLKIEIASVWLFYRSVFEHWRDNNSGEECVLRATR